MIKMRKVNTKDIVEEIWSSPKGKFAGGYKGVSIALGRKPESSDLKERHPFDIEIARVPPGRKNYPYHSHSAQWEFYHVLSGMGSVRHAAGTTPIVAGDAFIFGPDEPHQIINDSADDLILYVVADNPIGECAHYPDSKKWLVRSPERAFVRGAGVDYEDGEE